MSGKTVRVFTLSVLLLAGVLHASAQTAPTESVTVTATKSREVFSKFVKGFAAPTKLMGKIARWDRRICPLVLGQKSNFNTFIAQRVKYVALAAGARINPEPSCIPNIEIVFTTTPQDLIDHVRQHQPYFLGYVESGAEINKLATVTRPIQAWYTTETVDAHGLHQVDVGWLQGANIPSADVHGDALSTAPSYASTGGRINDGITSGFNHVLIVVDSTRLAGQKIVPLADYISMLALTQLNSLEDCPQQPSIVSLLAANCDHAVDGLTEFDLAYLHGLYRMRADRGLMFQRNDIADLMADRVTPVPVATAGQ
jgi:hypothetical protein